MIQFVPFRTEHAAQMMAIEQIPWDDNVLRKAAVAACSGPGVTAYCDDLPMAAAGVVVLWKGFGEAWALLGKDLKGHQAAVVTLAVRRHLLLWFAELELVRVQCYRKADNYAGHKWLEAVGFGKGALLEKFGPGGEDHYMYWRLANG